MQKIENYFGCSIWDFSGIFHKSIPITVIGSNIWYPVPSVFPGILVPFKSIGIYPSLYKLDSFPLIVSTDLVSCCENFSLPAALLRLIIDLEGVL